MCTSSSEALKNLFKKCKKKKVKQHTSSFKFAEPFNNQLSFTQLVVLSLKIVQRHFMVQKLSWTTCIMVFFL